MSVEEVRSLSEERIGPSLLAFRILYFSLLSQRKKQKPSNSGEGERSLSSKFSILNNLGLLAESGGFEPPIELLVL